MRNIFVFIGIVVFVAVLISFMLQLLRNSRQKQFMYLLQNGKFDELYKKIDSFYTKLIFPEYNRDYVRLNALIMQDRKNDIDLTFEKLILMAKDKKAKIDILNKAFEYYVYEEDKRHCEKIMEEIKKFEDDQWIKLSKMKYDILILKKSNHIEELEKDFDDQPVVQKINNAYLLSEQYRNLGNEEKFKYYLDISKSLIEGEK